MSCENNSKRLNLIQISRIVRMMKSRGYIVYTEPFKLNIVGVRDTNTNPELFDDKMYVFWKNDEQRWVGKEYIITTDPSTSSLHQVKNPKGVAILPAGQYVDAWKIRPHGQSQYLALGQQKILCVYRDYDRDALLNFNIDSKDCGYFGINIHRAKYGDADDGQGNTKIIGPYSEGCQVFQNYYCFQEFMDMANRQKNLYGNNFTYTLIDKSLERKFRLKRTLYFTSILISLGLLGKGIQLRLEGS